MIITVSDLHGVKQYNLPNNIKKMVISFLFMVVFLIGGLSFYVKTLNDKLVRLEKNINTDIIVEKTKEHSSLLVKEGTLLQNNSESLQAYELAIFEDENLEQEAKIAFNKKEEQEALLKRELEKQAKVLTLVAAKDEERKKALALEVERKELEALVKVEQEHKEMLVKIAEVKAEKFARIKFDTAALINAEIKKKNQLEKLEKLAKAKKIKLEKLAKAKRKKEALAKAEKKQKAKLVKLAKAKKAKKLKLAKLKKAKQKKKILAQALKKKKLKEVKIAKIKNFTTYGAFKKNINLRKSFKIFENKSLLAKANSKNTKLTVDISDQRVKLYVDGKVALSSPCTTGAKRKFEPNTKIYRDKRTPKGTFKITEKIANKRSTIFGKFYRNGKVVYKGDRRKYRGPKANYKGASLKNWMRLTSGGIGLHASKYVKRYPGTNGCIRLPYRVSKTIFRNVRKGTKVSIIN